MEVNRNYANSIMLTGRATKDGDYRSFSEERGVYFFRLATNIGYKNKEGEWIKTGTVFKDVKIIGAKALVVRSMNIKKGDLVYVEGRNDVEHYEKNGEQRSSEFIRVFSENGIEIMKRYDASKSTSTDGGLKPPTDDPISVDVSNDDLPF